ncbi:hypothetical protein DH2020_044355 [Rehmannia glutinosa]|uniref:F-box protein n=1 Tax=Rehmannia glutinosa TaxID=99300 RepID=A0ABR0UIW7_REHGL
MKPNTEISKTAGDSSPEKSSAEIVASFNNLLTDIYLRLPLKPLARFKLVSKHWNSLISNHLRNLEPNPAEGLVFDCANFAERHANNLPHAYFLSFNKSFEKLTFTKEYPGRWRTRILHSCNGLWVCGPHEGLGKYYVCNPTTKKFSILPELEKRRGSSKKIHGMILAFDSFKSPYYKVVCVLEFGDLMDNQYQFKVYSSKTGSWSKCSKPFTAQVNFQDGVYWNGSIHWISFTETGKSLYFNPDDQMLKTMPMPPIQEDSYSRRNYYFGESCDHLHYIDTYRKMLFEFNVYEMKRDYSEWFVKYKGGLSHVINNLCFICALVRGKKDENSFLVLRIKGKIIRYNLIYKTSETIHELDDVQRHFFTRARFPVQYIESLCPV